MRGRILKELDPDSAPVIAYEHAVERCNEWFDAPEDAEWPTSFFDAPMTRSARILTRRMYAISLHSPEERTFERAYALANTAYWRVCALRMSRFGAPWLGAALEERATIHLLRQPEMSFIMEPEGFGLDNYIEQQEESFRCFKNNKELSAALDWGKLRVSALTRPRHEPAAAAWVLGVLLEEKLGWRRLCRIPSSGGYEKWYSSLDSDEAEWLSRILNGEGRSF